MNWMRNFESLENEEIYETDSQFFNDKSQMSATNGRDLSLQAGANLYVPNNSQSSNALGLNNYHNFSEGQFARTYDQSQKSA
jgi:hypothetical protein